MKKPLILLLAVVVVLAAAAYGAYVITQQPNSGPAPIVKYGERGSAFIAQFLKYDSDNDGAITYEEFAKGYNDFKLIKCEREVYDVKEAFAMLDIFRDKKLDRFDMAALDKERDAQEANKRREDLAAQGLYLKTYGKVELVLNPTQRDWLDTEIGCTNREELPYGGMRFERKWFGDWEDEKGPAAGSMRRLKRSFFAHVVFNDGTVIDGFALESGSEESAQKLGLAPNKVYVLNADARITAHAREKVKSIDFLLDSKHGRYIKEVSTASPADVPKQLELARQCAKDGMQADSLTLYKRVLIFEHDNSEALEALGYKLNGRQYVKVQ